MGIKLLSILLALFVLPNVCAQTQDDEGYAAERKTAITIALQHMTDRDWLVRQRAAEVLAKFTAVEHQRLVEGYRMQEKNERVRLALDWALYRMGKRDALYGVVRELRSVERRPQAVGYLTQLAGPQPLYLFLDRAERKTLIGLLEVMARIGDADTVELIKPFTSSDDLEVAESAVFAQKEITLRHAQSPPELTTRPREVPAHSKVGP